MDCLVAEDLLIALDRVTISLQVIYLISFLLGISLGFLIYSLKKPFKKSSTLTNQTRKSKC